MSYLAANVHAVTLVPMTVMIAAPAPVVRPASFERLPGSASDDPFLRLAAAWLIGHGTNTATAYRCDLQAWSTWCASLGEHPLAAERHHVDLWVRHLTTQPELRTGRPASPPTVARNCRRCRAFTTSGSTTPRY
jgi:integrase/recombinase XerD